VALFLLGLPTIVAAFERAQRRATLKAAVLAAALLFVFVVDNAVWLTAMSARALGARIGRDLPPGPFHLGYGLTADERELYAWMSEKARERHIVVSEDDRLAYLATVYTPLRSWRSHYANTPWSAHRLGELRQFFDSGTVVAEWRVRPTLIVFRDSTGWQSRVRNFDAVSAGLAFRNTSYTVISMTPSSGAEGSAAHQAGRRGGRRQLPFSRGQPEESRRDAFDSVVRELGRTRRQRVGGLQ
jgi:hypothetical protein